MGCYLHGTEADDDGTKSTRYCDEPQLVFTEGNPANADYRLFLQFINDPCRDECNTDESCQNYVAPPDSCTAEEEVVEEVEEVEETEETTETTAAEVNETVIGSIAVAVSAITLVGLIFVNA